MHVAILDRLNQVPAAAWNALAPNNPFLTHEFLSALERTGCVGSDTGWMPQYLVAREHAGSSAQLLGAVPLYLKHHSYGEFVFDWAWANASMRAGLPYYPKLVAAVPFTPVAGPRLLIAQHEDDHRVREQLIGAARECADTTRASSLHWLFTPENETEDLEAHGFLRRVGHQFHWTNTGFADFDDFLSTFSSEKRKKVKRERRFVREAGIEMQVLSGSDITSNHWDAFYGFYLSTIRKNGASAYLTRDFFHEIGRTFSRAIVLALARHQNRYVAAALNFRSRDTLYGRYWGASEAFHSLHFEACYYQAIEYCIREGLQRFEAGAQGEHKLSRGFLPVQTYSAHWLRDPRLTKAVAEFLSREQRGMAYYMDELNEHSPFKKDCQ